MNEKKAKALLRAIRADGFPKVEMGKQESFNPITESGNQSLACRAFVDRPKEKAMNITLTRRQANKMPARIQSLNAGPLRIVAEYIQNMPRPTAIRAVIAADLAIVALVVAGAAGWL